MVAQLSREEAWPLVSSEAFTGWLNEYKESFDAKAVFTHGRRSVPAVPRGVYD
jgi:hypothetical protein